MSIDVLLAVYNGESYLTEQINSLLKQEVSFRLLIRDDGSTDKSKEILQPFLNENIQLLPSQGRLGAVKNFSHLLKASTADYTFFCDQDDVWLPNKLQLSIKALSNNKPTLVHTDLQVVDKELNLLSSSFWSQQSLAPTSSLNALLVQNRVTGCTMGMNRALRELVGEIPEEAIMHDWWIALVAAAFGQIISLPIPTVLYRQHAANAIGAKTLLQRSLQRKRTLHRQQRKNQAEAFYRRYGPHLKSSQKEALQALLKAHDSTWLANQCTRFRYDFQRSGFLPKLASFFLSNPF